MEINRELIIDMNNINKGYMLGDEKVPVLKDVCFQVRKGEFVAILGPSGSGKTTLMNIIGCMDLADDGEYYLDGNPIHEMEEKELNDVRNREIGFIFRIISSFPPTISCRTSSCRWWCAACGQRKRRSAAWIP